MECGCPSGGGIKKGHIRYPSYGGTQKERKERLQLCLKLVLYMSQTIKAMAFKLGVTVDLCRTYNICSNTLVDDLDRDARSYS